MLWLHGLGESKWSGVLPAPLDGICLVSVDRFGHGRSSPLAGPTDLAKDVPAYMELMDELKVKQFYVCGHSYGGLTAVQIAAAQPERVLGIAPISAPVYGYDKGLSKEERSKTDTTPGKMILNLNKKTCWGSFSRWAIGKMAKMTYYPDKSKDPGLAGRYKLFAHPGSKSPENPSVHEIAGNDASKTAMDKDLFYVSALMDSGLHGLNHKKCQLLEWSSMSREEGPFFDVSLVKCPCFIYNGRYEGTNFVCAEFYHRQIQGSELIVMADHGHVSIGREAGKIIKALVQGKAASADLTP